MRIWTRPSRYCAQSCLASTPRSPRRVLHAIEVPGLPDGKLMRRDRIGGARAALHMVWLVFPPIRPCVADCRVRGRQS